MADFKFFIFMECVLIGACLSAGAFLTMSAMCLVTICTILIKEEMLIPWVEE